MEITKDRGPGPWLERRAGECAYPVADTGWRTWSCRAPVRRGAYCSFHHRAMRGPPASRFEDLVALYGSLEEDTACAPQN